MRGKVILFVIVSCVVIIVVVSLALVTMHAYPGGEVIISPTDVVILRGGMSSVWCEGQTIDSDGTTFNASVVAGNPRINPNSRRKRSIRFSEVPLSPSNSRVYWRFYLPQGSNIDLSQCAKSTGVMGYILKGHDVDDGCIYYSLFNKLKSHTNCTDIWLAREIVRTCRGSKQMIHASITKDDYYLVLYQSSYPDDTTVSVNITLDTPTYDLSDSLTNCSSNQECTLPLRFASDDTVVVSLMTNITSKDATIDWTCAIRTTMYFITFLGVPLVIILIIIAAAICCVRKRRKNDPPVTNQPPIAEPREVDREKEPLLRGRIDDLLPSIDHRLREIGPIPGPSFQPIHPPTAPPRDDDGDQPFQEPVGHGYPPLPPTYEETMRAEENDNHRERIAEKC